MSSPAHRHPPRLGPLRLALKRLGLLASAAVFAASVHAAPQDGGVLNLIAQPEPPSLMHGVVTHVSTQYVSGKILQGLLTFDTDLKPKPVLARSWTVSPDGLTYTFELQPDVQWHDDKPFTASDVKFSFGTFYPEVDKRIASAVSYTHLTLPTILLV